MSVWLLFDAFNLHENFGPIAVGSIVQTSLYAYAELIARPSEIVRPTFTSTELGECSFIGIAKEVCDGKSNMDTDFGNILVCWTGNNLRKKINGLVEGKGYLYVSEEYLVDEHVRFQRIPGTITTGELDIFLEILTIRLVPFRDEVTNCSTFNPSQPWLNTGCNIQPCEKTSIEHNACFYIFETNIFPV